MKVAVIGAGAIGGLVGARLAAAGEDVTFLVRGHGVVPVILLSMMMATTALVGLAALRLVRPLVNSKIPILIPANSRTAIFAWNTGLWKYTVALVVNMRAPVRKVMVKAIHVHLRISDVMLRKGRWVEARPRSRRSIMAIVPKTSASPIT